MITSTTNSDLAVLDTDMLVYAIDEESEHHHLAKTVVDRASNNAAGLCVTHQVLAEFFSVVTNPKRVHKPMTSQEAVSTIESFLAMPGIIVIPVPADLVERWLNLIRIYSVSGPRVFDVQLAET